MPKTFNDMAVTEGIDNLKRYHWRNNYQHLLRTTDGHSHMHKNTRVGASR